MFGDNNWLYDFEEPSSSMFITAASLVVFLITVVLAASEATGKHLQYSKFHGVSAAKSSVSGKHGMLIFYGPALLAAVSSFALYPNPNLAGMGFRFLLVQSTLTIHFLKRILEVLFVHKFSGSIRVDTIAIVSSYYLTAAAGTIHFQALTTHPHFPQSSVDLKYIGLTLFVVGICGNFYHHYILSRLRSGDKEKGYKIPRGGLFDLVVCPHYLFEILIFFGMAFVSQTLFSFSCAFGSSLYLVGRSFTTRKWYVSKFDNFPKDVKALIPFVF